MNDKKFAATLCLFAGRGNMMFPLEWAETSKLKGVRIELQSLGDNLSVYPGNVRYKRFARRAYILLALLYRANIRWARLVTNEYYHKYGYYGIYDIHEEYRVKDYPKGDVLLCQALKEAWHRYQASK